MPALTAEAIQRLSPSVDSILVSQGERVALRNVPADSRASRVKERDPARALDEALFCENLRPLLDITGDQFEMLKSIPITCSIQAISKDRVHRRAKTDRELDAVSIYIFKPGAIDPAQLLSDRLRMDPKLDQQALLGVAVLRRNVTNLYGSTNLYFCSPAPRVAIVARQEKLLEETIRQWKSDKPSEPFPWNLPEWNWIPAGATSWGLCLHSNAGRHEGGVLVIDPIAEPGAFREVWTVKAFSDLPGVLDGAAFRLLQQLANEAPNDVQLVEGDTRRLDLRFPLDPKRGENWEYVLGMYLYPFLPYMSVPPMCRGAAEPERPDN